MSDPVAFLRARLDEDEKTARAAAEGPWKIRKSTRALDDELGISSGDVEIVGPGYEGGGVWDRPDAEHIIRHDPARVLDEVDAKRRILDECNWGGPDHGDVYWAVLERLALPYAGHPDYRGEWRPR